MKARLLKKLLNNTGYRVQWSDNKVCIGSALCHDLINVDATTLKLRYELDTFREGVKSIKNEKLEAIWYKLEELIKSGEIKDIIEGIEEVENPITIYKVEDGKLITAYTEANEWPNVTHDGRGIHDGEYSLNKLDAYKRGIDDLQYWDERLTERIQEKQKEIDELIVKKSNNGTTLFYLKQELEKLSK
jgi:chromosome segregation ATPase